MYYTKKFSTVTLIEICYELTPMMTNLIVNKNERILNKVKGGDSIKKTKFISDRKIMKGMVYKRRQQKTDRVSDN